VSLIRGSDPLALLAIQAGARPTPGQQGAAQGSNPLDVQQQAHAIGEPVPIVFGRRRNGAGGVFVSPKATECRFENDAAHAVTAWYHLVLSEGRIGALQVRDVFQRQCRVGTFKQTYNRRAGNWQPENAIVVRAGYDKPEATYFCGTVGNYPGISTLSFRVTVPDGFDVWNRQVHAFVRHGMEVYRWADSTADVSSDSMADLSYWLMLNSARIPAALIDTDSIQAASVFLNANSITTNCWITDAINYSELIARWGPYHLLRSSTRNGKAGLKPLLQVNTDGTIKTTPLTVAYTFDDDLVIPGSEEIVYSDWASRQPFVAQMIWRQQLDADVGIIRTAEVRYSGTAANGPYESHDLSAFCTREDHAVKVGAYLLAKRIRSTHTMRLRVRPQAHNTLVQQGSIVRVRLSRNASGDVPAFHDYLYSVERITRTLSGDVQFDLSHEPVDSQGRSLIALDVVSATGAGILLSSNLTGLGCDLNSSSDTTSPTDDEFLEPDPDGDDGTTIDPGDDTPITDPGGGGSGGGGSDEPEPAPNPDDDLQNYLAGLFFHSVAWDSNVLQVKMRISPTGKAPRDDLGALSASISSTSVVALLPNGQPVSPQPTGLPTVSFTGTIANPWNPVTEGLPVPPANRVFEGQFNIPFDASSFPPAAEDPSQQLTYRAVVAFSSWSGGFTDVAFLNTAVVDFEPTEVTPEPPSGTNHLVIYHPDTSPPLAIPGTTASVAVQVATGEYGTEEYEGVNSLTLLDGNIVVTPTGTGGTWAPSRTGFNTLEAYIKVPADAILTLRLLAADNSTIFKAAMWGNGTYADIGDDSTSQGVTHGVSLTGYVHFAIGVSPTAGTTAVFLNGSRIYAGTYAGATPAKAMAAFSRTVSTASGAVISQIALSDSLVPTGTTIATPYLYPSYPFYAIALLLLHMDGANDSTTFTDSSQNALTVTANGNARITTADKKLGTGACLLDSNGDWLSINNAILATGDNDFTIEAWVKVASTASGDGYMGLFIYPELEGDDGASTGLYVYAYNGAVYGEPCVCVWYDGIAGDEGAAGDPEVSGEGFALGEWAHVAAVCQSGVISLFVNGVKCGATYSDQPSISSSVVLIGRTEFGDGEFFDGKIDELRLSIGAVYTTNFTPPTAPFS
jgi:hypothetical protein